MEGDTQMGKFSNIFPKKMITGMLQKISFTGMTIQLPYILNTAPRRTLYLGRQKGLGDSNRTSKEDLKEGAKNGYLKKVTHKRDFIKDPKRTPLK